MSQFHGWRFMAAIGSACIEWSKYKIDTDERRIVSRLAAANTWANESDLCDIFIIFLRSP